MEPLHKCPKCGAPDGKRDKSRPDQPPLKGFCLGKDIHSHSGYCLGFFDKYGPGVGREKAKTFNHAVSYGMGANTLARREGIENEEAQKMLDIMYATYPGIQRLTWRVRQEIERTGAVRLFSGHVRHFPIQKLLRDSGNFFDWEWEGTIREGVNVLAQGGTGILMKRAMIKLYRRLQEEEELRGIQILSQVHDELVLEGPKGRIRAGLAAMIWELEHAAPELTVPVIAEGAVGPDWGSCK
jgi:DNA polymerase I-like protein with 3'-5' exonuclease and polymerase domains